jgi:hypothetical protein
MVAELSKLILILTDLFAIENSITFSVFEFYVINYKAVILVISGYFNSIS